MVCFVLVGLDIPTTSMLYTNHMLGSFLCGLRKHENFLLPEYLRRLKESSEMRMQEMSLVYPRVWARVA